MRIDLSCYLLCPYEEAVEQVKTPRLLEYVAAPLASFVPVDREKFPPTCEEGTYTVKLRLGGLVPLGEQNIVISFPETDRGFSLRDNGYSSLIRRWDHTITILPTAAGVLYRDTVVISAGLLTPMVWLFAYVFFRHRQRRWQRLAASGFAYESKNSARPTGTLR